MGDWRDVLDGVTCDALITDPPYSARTHAGQLSNIGGSTVNQVTYASIDRGYCDAFVSAWLSRVRHWWVIFGDDKTQGWWRDALDDVGLMTFASVAWVKGNPMPRVTGDGPTSAVEWITIARTRGKWATSPPWGSLDGRYLDNTAGGQGFAGAKPLYLMRALVRDYSRPGWTICDPHVGSGTTLLACDLEGRLGIGSEQDAGRYEIARRRLAAPQERSLFAGVAS
jgi:site-specific DNA-methyltransferase (adenine-specific)